MTFHSCSPCFSRSQPRSRSPGCTGCPVALAQIPHWPAAGRPAADPAQTPNALGGPPSGPPLAPVPSAWPLPPVCPPLATSAHRGQDVVSFTAQQSSLAAAAFQKPRAGAMASSGQQSCHVWWGARFKPGRDGRPPLPYMSCLSPPPRAVWLSSRARLVSRAVRGGRLGPECTWLGLGAYCHLGSSSQNKKALTHNIQCPKPSRRAPTDFPHEGE